MEKVAFIVINILKWHKKIIGGARTQYQTVWPGIELKCEGDERAMTAVLTLQAGVDPRSYHTGTGYGSNHGR
ncbi:hypothetical protein JW935_14155 [candidate division KSB1 bacterium]|nr:hypothetical protein [candidate division KSB1 bacterium]